MICVASFKARMTKDIRMKELNMFLFPSDTVFTIA